MYRRAVQSKASEFKQSQENSAIMKRGNGQIHSGGSYVD